MLSAACASVFGFSRDASLASSRLVLRSGTCNVPGSHVLSMCEIIYLPLCSSSQFRTLAQTLTGAVHTACKGGVRHSNVSLSSRHGVEGAGQNLSSGEAGDH